MSLRHLRDSCRGILIAGATNTARTQIAEALLRRRLGQFVTVRSTGDRHLAGGGAASQLHPMALAALAERDAELAAEAVRVQSAKVLGGMMSKNFDVIVRVVNKPVTASSTALAWTPAAGFDETELDEVLQASSAGEDGPLAGADRTPAHWQVATRVGTLRRKQELWSTDDVTIAHKNNTKQRMSDEYQGEPLFEMPRAPRFNFHVEQQWELDDVTRRRPLEREAEHMQRFRLCLSEIDARVEALVAALETRYGRAAADELEASLPDVSQGV